MFSVICNKQCYDIKLKKNVCQHVTDNLLNLSVRLFVYGSFYLIVIKFYIDWCAIIAETRKNPLLKILLRKMAAEKYVSLNKCNKMVIFGYFSTCAKMF